MKDKINVAQLLKDCPKGMELDCTMYDSLYFDYVDEFNIIHCYIQYDNTYKTKTSITLNRYGAYNSDIKSKCVIFPKGKTTWEGFQRPFVDGDIISYQLSGYRNRTIYIYKHHPTMNTSYYVALGGNLNFMVNLHEGGALCGNNTTARFATEDEKEKLFKAIKDNGYKWNAETKTLEKLIKPKFKVGDTITNGKTSITIGYIDNEYYYEISRNIANRLFIKNQDEWSLIDDKFPIKFNINTLVPFESRVLVRDNVKEKWHPGIWGYYDNDTDSTYPYKLIGVITRYCIPYEANEHLLGTTDDCDEYFKTWK